MIKKPPDNVIRTVRDRNFKTISCDVLDNQQLSWRAKGLLVYLITRPDGWRFFRAAIDEMGTEGRDAVTTALGELRKAGYIKLERGQGKGGKFGFWIWYVSETPQQDWLSTDALENRNSEKPNFGKSATNIIHCDNTPRIDNKEQLSIESLPPTAVDLADDSSGSGQKQKRGRKKKAVPANKDWMVPYYEAVRSRYGGTPNGGIIARNLWPLHEKFGVDVIMPQWEAYLQSTEASFYSPSKFKDTHGSWEGGNDPRRAARLTAAPSQARRF